MHSSALATISLPRASSSEAVVRQWIVVFGEIHGREITPELVGIWCQLLGDIEASLLDRACKETAARCRFFPTPADIRAQIEAADATALELKAERAWEKLLEYIRRYYLPDVPGQLSRSAPPLPKDMEYAMRAAGGLGWIESCPIDQLPWAKKAFTEAYRRVQASSELQNLPSTDEARKLLATVAALGKLENSAATPMLPCATEQPSAGSERMNGEGVE